MTVLKRQFTKPILRSVLSIFDLKPKLVRRERIRIAVNTQESAVQAASSWNNVWTDLNAVIARRVKK